MTGVDHNFWKLKQVTYQGTKIQTLKPIGFNGYPKKRGK